MKGLRHLLQLSSQQPQRLLLVVCFARVMFDAFGGAQADWTQIVAFLSLVSMFLGAVAAIGQTNIKRLMAYSSIAHMGFALMGPCRWHGRRR